MLARAVDEQLEEQRSWRGALESMEERLESLEEAVGSLESRLARWSDPSEVADEVVGLEEEVSVALGRFHKRLEAATESMEEAVRSAVGSELGALRRQLESVKEELERLPELLAEHQAAILHDLKSRRDRRRGD